LRQCRPPALTDCVPRSDSLTLWRYELHFRYGPWPAPRGTGASPPTTDRSVAASEGARANARG
jgi:hypothetical protein